MLPPPWSSTSIVCSVWCFSTRSCTDKTVPIRTYPHFFDNASSFRSSLRGRTLPSFLPLMHRHHHGEEAGFMGSFHVFPMMSRARDEQSMSSNHSKTPIPCFIHNEQSTSSELQAWSTAMDAQTTWEWGGRRASQGTQPITGPRA